MIKWVDISKKAIEIATRTTGYPVAYVNNLDKKIEEAEAARKQLLQKASLARKSENF